MNRRVSHDGRRRWAVQTGHRAVRRGRPNLPAGCRHQQAVGEGRRAGGVAPRRLPRRRSKRSSRSVSAPRRSVGSASVGRPSATCSRHRPREPVLTDRRCRSRAPAAGRDHGCRIGGAATRPSCTSLLERATEPEQAADPLDPRRRTAPGCTGRGHGSGGREGGGGEGGRRAPSGDVRRIASRGGPSRPRRWVGRARSDRARTSSTRPADAGLARPATSPMRWRRPVPASVEWKLDGARIQAHRAGAEVRLFTRNLNDVTDRLSGVVDLVRALPGGDLVLDGEVLGVAEDGGPRRFQDTMGDFGADSGGSGGTAEAAVWRRSSSTCSMPEPRSSTSRSRPAGSCSPRSCPGRTGCRRS